MSAESRNRSQAGPNVRAARQVLGIRSGKGRTASIDPEALKIVDGKLYLIYYKGGQENREQDVPGIAPIFTNRLAVRLGGETRPQRVGPLRNTPVHLVTFNSVRASLIYTLGS